MVLQENLLFYHLDKVYILFFQFVVEKNWVDIFGNLVL